jgi:hypothetical protein
MKRATGKTLTTQLEARRCPQCFCALDACTSLTAAVQPQPGDYTICIGCASVLRFTETMDFELSSLEAIPTHSRMGFAQAVQAVKKVSKPSLLSDRRD